MKRGAPVIPRKLAAVVVFAVATPIASACTLLVNFHEPDGSTGDADIVELDAESIDDRVVTPVLESGAPDVVVDETCRGKPDGFQWGTVATARCCHGLKRNFALDSDNNDCGVCNMKCINGQHCAQSTRGYFYCVGCAPGGVANNSACQTQCCSGDHDDSSAFSNPNDQNVGVCSASNCSAVCNPSACPAPSTCITPSGLSYVCVYQ